MPSVWSCRDWLAFRRGRGLAGGGWNLAEGVWENVGGRVWAGGGVWWRKGAVP